MQAHSTFSPDNDSLRLGPAARRMIIPGLVLAAAGGATAVYCGLADGGPTRLFFHAYLVAFLFYLAITLGALFFVMLHHLARAGWSVTLRRLAEALSGNVLLMALLFLPIIPGLGEIYEWSHPKALITHVRYDTDENGNTVTTQTTTELGESEGYVGYAGRELWLTPRAFYTRFAIYFVLWGFLAWFLRRRSIQQDRGGDPRLSTLMERLSAPGMIVFAVTLTLAAVDLVMSLNPHWFSTMIGVYFFTNAVLGAFVVLTLLAMWLQANGLLRGTITAEHYHDLGKLIFGFVVFWGYIAFSQYMLIWYANIPEETQFYMPRQIGPWAAVSIVLIVFHLVIPFFGLLSRHIKRSRPALAFWLVWLLVAQALDFFWLVMPNTFIQEIPTKAGLPPGTPLPEAFKQMLASHQSVYRLAESHADFMSAIVAPLQLGGLATVIGLIVGMGGLYLASTALLLQGAALVPTQDPRLNESLQFHNI